MRIAHPTSSTTRRGFLRDMAVGAGALATAATLLSLAGCEEGRQSGARVPGAGEKLRIGLVGVGGKGKSNLEGVLKTGEEVIALCDVDETKLDEAAKIAAAFPQARRYRDYRQMIDKEGDLQAVTRRYQSCWSNSAMKPMPPWICCAARQAIRHLSLAKALAPTTV